MTNENFCARLLITHLLKQKRADLCFNHKADPRSFYEAGSCQVDSDDCFTLLFEFATLAHYGAEVCGSHSTVRRVLILNHEFCSQVL